jgi:two-component system chemotaxis response regulator CheB
MLKKARNQSPRPSYVVMGTSAGGVVALSRVFKDIPANFPGAILVVFHVHEAREMRWLSELLAGVGHIPVKVAQEGEAIEQGRAYVAPAGTHLLLSDERIELGTGPAEQRFRPAIDALFRSAAEAFGPRVIGVILTGMLRDGAAGLRAIHDAGGISIVQDPASAYASELPRNAMEGFTVDYCLDLSEIGPLLDLLVRRAGSMKKGVLETGLASSVRLMKDRLHLLGKLEKQSRKNPRTAKFVNAELLALEREIVALQRLLPRKGGKTRRK